MKTYREFRPTGFDVAGLGCADRQTWLVAPCSTNRDADTLVRSNWDVQLKCVEECSTSDDYETHEFGHWACGWFRLLLVRPGSPAETVCSQLEDKLADYPVLDESYYSELEFQEEYNKTA